MRETNIEYWAIALKLHRGQSNSFAEPSAKCRHLRYDDLNMHICDFCFASNDKISIRLVNRDLIQYKDFILPVLEIPLWR